jgi:hypothetical protein
MNAISAHRLFRSRLAAAQNLAPWPLVLEEILPDEINTADRQPAPQSRSRSCRRRRRWRSAHRAQPARSWVYQLSERHGRRMALAEFTFPLFDGRRSGLADSDAAKEDGRSRARGSDGSPAEEGIGPFAIGSMLRLRWF